MSGRRPHAAWWQELHLRGERFNGAERVLLGVAALALGGALLVLVRVLG